MRNLELFSWKCQKNKKKKFSKFELKEELNKPGALKSYSNVMSPHLLFVDQIWNADLKYVISRNNNYNFNFITFNYQSLVNKKKTWESLSF